MIGFRENSMDMAAAIANASSVCPEGNDESPPVDNFSIDGKVSNGRSRFITPFSPWLANTTRSNTVRSMKNFMRMGFDLFTRDIMITINAIAMLTKVVVSEIN